MVVGLGIRRQPVPSLCRMIPAVPTAKRFVALDPHTPTKVSWVPLGTNTNYRFALGVKTPSLQDLKITKLLMVCTGEERRPHIAHCLWTMRKFQLEKMT